MRIKMLYTMRDPEFDNRIVWNENDIFEVDDDLDDIYLLKEVDGMPYGVDKHCNGQMFIEIDKNDEPVMYIN